MEKIDFKKSLASKSLIYIISDIGLKAIGFFLIPIYTHHLPPQEYGIIAITAAIIQIISPLIGLGLISCLPILYYETTPEKRKTLISSTIIFLIGYGLIVTILLSLFSAPIFNMFNIGIAFKPYILISLWTVFFNLFFYLPQGIYNMEKKPTQYLFYSVGISTLGMTLNMLFVVFLKLNALGLLIAGLINSMICLFVALMCLRSYLRIIFDLSHLKNVFRLSIPNLPHAFSGTILLYADRFFLSALGSLTDTGIYSLASMISSILTIISGGLTTALNPAFFESANKNDMNLSKEWAKRFTQITAVTCMVGIILIAFSGEIIFFLAPKQYQKSATIVPILIIGQLFISFYWMFSPAIGFKKKMWAFPISSYIAITINILMNIHLVPKFGAFGAAWALTASTAVQLLIFGAISLYYYPIKFEINNLLKIFFISLLILILSSLFQKTSSWPSIFGKVLLILTLPSLLIYWRIFPTLNLLIKRL